MALLSINRINRAVLLASVALPLGTSAAAAQDLMLKQVTVEAESDDTLVQDGYVAKRDRLGTKVDTPIVEIPQAVSTVTQDQIEDQRPRTLNEALTYTASSNPNSYGFDTRYDAFYLRGFPAYYNGIFRDGLRQYNGPSAWFDTEPYGIEGITILKGPASSLYGVSGPGGLVNIVTKRPKEEQFREVEGVFGSNNHYQGAFDFSGPANEDGTLLYRLTGVARDSGTFLPGYPDDKLYIAPAITWQPDADTKLTVLGEFSRGVTGATAIYYNPAYGTVSDIYAGDPAWNDFTNTQGRIGYEFEHRFNDVLTVRQNLRYSAVDADMKYSGFCTEPYQKDYYNCEYPDRTWSHYKENAESFVVDNMAQFEFATAGAQHTAVAGIDYSWSMYDSYWASSYTSRNDIKTMPVPYAGGQQMNNVGVYLHDQVDWNDFTLFASGRYDWVDTKSFDATHAETDQQDEAFSYRLGLSYRTDWGIIPYANYSTSFAPNIGLVYDDLSVPDPVGRVARPTVGTQKEIGVKYEIPNTNAVISAALFDIDQKDGVVFDTSTGINRQRQLDLNSRGFEIEANASFDNGFSLIASYTHLRMKIERGATGTEGKELSATPNDIVSLWGHYVFQSGPLVGLGLGAGVRYVGESFGDDLNTFKNEDRIFMDASISYDFGARNPELLGLLLQVNAKNLFDTRKQMCTAGYCYRDEGLAVAGSLRYRF